ncbi:putative reverse transcriptase-7 [Operophtera brumata]|uniref:Putative reverse transcriptase-7 n=1 Tax=Operophtera brumata TaxID=104452 RepID=A0A0L7LA89_OPEBR|nr:putative reverse transcriptase-7 [Operophtera brumata]
MGSSLDIPPALSHTENSISSESSSGHISVSMPEMEQNLLASRPQVQSYCTPIHNTESRTKSNRPTNNPTSAVSETTAIKFGRRIHDLTLLKISPEQFHITENSVIFWPWSKTDSDNHHQAGWHLKRNETKNLNAVFWVKKLLKTSQSRRSARQDLVSLFITTRGVVRDASRAIIAGWIKS